MGRMDELFYELYASSKRHDSWQRQAMIRELRNLLNQPKESGSDHFERSGEDRRFGEDDRRFRDYLMLRSDDDDETWTEHYSVTDDETDSWEEESMSQFQVPISDLEHGLQIHNASPTVCEDSQYVAGRDELCDHQKSILQVSYLKEVEELPQKSTSGNDEHVAHQLFDQKPLRVTHKEKQMKHLKAWKFKFKSTSKRSRLMDNKFSFVDATVLLNKDLQALIWNCVNKEFKETVAGCGKTGVDQFKPVHATPRPGVYDRPLQTRVWDSGGSLLEDVDEMFKGAKAVSMRFLLGIVLGITESDASQGQQAVFEKIVMMNEWLQTSLVIEQVMRDKKIKFTKQWMFKFKKKKIEQWLDYNLIVAYLGNKKIWTKSRVWKHDNLTWKEDASDESRSRSRMKLGDAMITCKNLLEKSSDKNVEIVTLSKSRGRSEISCEVYAFGDQESSMFRKFAVAFMDISTVVKTQGLGVVHVLHKDAVLDSKLSYLMGNMMGEDQKQQGDSQLLVIVLECVDAKGGVGMDKKPFHLSLRNHRVWDPGG